MTIRHTAYGFDAKHFAETVRMIAYENAVFDSVSLHKHAQQTFRTLSFSHSTYAELLAGLRIDEELLFPKAGDEPESHIDFLTLLCENLTPAPNLSQRIPMGYFVIQTAFPCLGWSENDIRSIIFGDPLETLLDLALPNAIHSFPKFPRECGWLSSERCSGIIPSVLRLIDMLSQSSAELVTAADALASYATERRSTPYALLQSVFFDVLEMLKWSQANQADLFLLLEY
ncbi:MAG: hypothetical protein ACXWFI_01160 [Methylobacter sp.]